MMAADNADRNLLFGVLALQMEFATHDQVLAALNAWTLAKDKTLGDVLIEHKALDADRRQLLDAVVAQRLKQHGNDVAQSLSALALPPALRDQLSRLADADLQASVRRTSGPAVPPVVDEYATNYGVAGVKTQPEIQLPADPFMTKAGGATQPEPPRAADPYATNLGSFGGVGGKTRPESQGGGATAMPTEAITATASPNRFRVLRPLARGGLGEVLVAEDEELHREVALKQIQSHHADDVESRARFEAEAQFTGLLEHPGIVPVYGLNYYADGRPYYAMRLIRGDSLKEAIDRFHKSAATSADPAQRNLELRELLKRFVDVCHAIEYAHSRGVLHRDLKPGNIMLGNYGETLVVDWGLAKTIDEKEKIPENPDQRRVTLSGTASATPTLMGAAVGTPQFMSPEQAAGQLDKLGPASDVYSLGATLYDLLTGTAPIVDRDIINLLQRVQKGDFPKPRDIKAGIPPALEAICLKAMKLKPEDRYATPKLLADDLGRWLADEPVTAFPEPWSAKAARWVRRHPAIVAVAAAAVVFISIIAVLLNVAERRERVAKLQAQRNYELARAAVDRYHTHVSEDMLLNEPGMQPLRRQLLKDAEEFYGKFVAEHKDDPTVTVEMARAKFRLGQITGEIHNEKDAVALLKEAADVFERDAATEPAELARCYHHLGRLSRLTDDFDASQKWYQKALALWASIGGRTDDHLAGWARSEFGMGNVLQRVRQYDESAAQYGKALAMLDKLAGNKAAAPEHRRDLAVVHNDLGIVYTLMGNKTKEAEEQLKKAIQLQEQLIKELPNISKFQNDLGASHFNLGDAHLQGKKSADAVADYQTAVKIFEQLTQTNPSVLDYQSRLADSYAALANALLADNQAEPAVKLSKRALEVQQQLVDKSRAGADKNAPAAKYRGHLALRYVEHGDLMRRAGQPAAAATAYQEAAKIQQQLTIDVPQTADYHAQLGRSHQGLGMLHLQEKRFDRAEAEFTEALRIWVKLQKEHPTSAEVAGDVGSAMINLRAVTRLSPGYRLALTPLDGAIAVLASHANIDQHPSLREALFQSYWTRAEARTSHALFTEALLDWSEALGLAPAKQRPWVSLDRCVTLARYGQSDEAVGEAKTLLEAAGKAPKALVPLARIFALAASAEAKKTEGNVELAKKRAEEHAGETIRILERAHVLGWFNSVDERTRLAADPDWQILRGRAAFEALLRQPTKKE